MWLRLRFEPPIERIICIHHLQSPCNFDAGLMERGENKLPFSRRTNLFRPQWFAVLTETNLGNTEWWCSLYTSNHLMSLPRRNNTSIIHGTSISLKSGSLSALAPQHPRSMTPYCRLLFHYPYSLLFWNQWTQSMFKSSLWQIWPTWLPFSVSNIQGRTVILTYLEMNSSSCT